MKWFGGAHTHSIIEIPSYKDDEAFDTLLREREKRWKKLRTLKTQ